MRRCAAERGGSAGVLRVLALFYLSEHDHSKGSRTWLSLANLTFLLQCDPPDNAVPEGEQPLQNADHLAGGNHSVVKHRGEPRQLHSRY